MRPILPGARGPAVEDIQRRLLKIGYDLGPTGVDGVFLGMTRDAVTAFQRRLGLQEDGVVGPETWSALVDSTFTIGDRTLYLRLPHFHGHDVLVLQEALSALGFSCGSVDGIFGSSTEHAVRAFQRNCGQGVDGIAGAETITALNNLVHVWEGKSGAPSGSMATGRARSREALRRTAVEVDGRSALTREVAGRIVNLALASADDALVSLAVQGADPGPGALRLVLVQDPDPVGLAGVPVAAMGQDAPGAFASRLVTAIAAAGAPTLLVGVDVGDLDVQEESMQRAAVRLLDALCVALA